MNEQARDLTAADAEPARVLLRASLGGSPYLERALELLAEACRDTGDTTACVFEQDGVVEALALFGAVAGSHGVFKLHALVMRERASAAGSALLSYLARRARAQQGLSLIAELPADPVYGRTLTLLRGSGFRQEGRIPDYFREGVALLFLRRPL